MIDLRTASRSAARVARHRRAAPASELALVVLYTQAAIVGGLFQACPTDSISHCRFQCYRPLVAQRAGIPRSRVLSENNDEAIEAAGDALMLLARLRGYMVPGGRMSVIRELALRLRNLDEPFAILNALQLFESELICLGGKCDDDLVETLALVKRSLPGALLVSFHRRLDS